MTDVPPSPIPPSPEADFAALLADYNRPLFGFEQRKPLQQYHCLGFSLAYELGGCNVLHMLRMAHVPITWQERLQVRKFERHNRIKEGLQYFRPANGRRLLLEAWSTMNCLDWALTILGR